MKNTEDTTDTPGEVFTTSRAGRMVWAVVWTAPETIPSACPSSTIIVPKYDTSVTSARAFSRSIPRCRRRSWYAAASSSSSGERVGSTTRAVSTSRPRSAALRRTISGSPSRVRSAMPRRSTTSAARSTRSSSPSGSTTWRRSATARSTSRCSNISGVTASLRATASRSSSAGPSTCSSNSANDVVIFRVDSLVSRPRRLLSADAVS